MLRLKSDGTQRVRDVLYVYRRIIDKFKIRGENVPPIIMKRYRQLRKESNRFYK